VTVAKKLGLLPFVSMIGIVLLAGVMLRDIGSVYRSASYATDTTVPTLLILQKFDANFIGERLNVWQHVATPDAAGMAAAEKQMAGRREKIDEAIKAYEPLVVDEKDKEMLASDRAAVEYYDGVKAKVLDLSRAGKKTEAIGILMSLKSDLAKAGEALTLHLKQNVERAKAASVMADETRRSAIRLGVLLTLATLLAVGLLGLLIFKQITSQLGGEPKDVAEVARKVAQGDFSSPIKLRRGDTVSLFAAVGQMQEDLKKRVESDRARLDAERARAAAEAAAGVENARIRTALDRVSAAVTLIDAEGVITYANEFALTLFRGCAGQIAASVPQFQAERLLGMRFDTLYQAASGQRAGIADLPAGHSEELKLSGATLRITATPVRDPQGIRVGTVVQWVDRTQEIIVEEELAATVAKAVAGDLTVKVREDGKQGFFKVLAVGMNRLIVSVAEIVRTMSHAANEVRTGADEISRGNLDLSQRTEQQASALEETAASMEEMTAMVKNTADNAAQANQLANAAREQAERGGKVVGSAVSAMSEINQASKRIADIIGVIDDIAFQTNLLALNAAVEAARAGEQGRGFAVVASEVRNLASRSAEAAKEIKGLIQDSVTKVSDGAQLVDQSGKVLGEIVAGVKKVTDMMAEIAASSSEQATGIEEVNKALTSMDGVTQQNAALVEQASAAAQTLTDQAANLTELIARYRLDGTPPAVAPAAGPAPSAACAEKAPVVERRGAKRPFSRPSKREASGAGQAGTAKLASGGEETWQEF